MLTDDLRVSPQGHVGESKRHRFRKRKHVAWSEQREGGEGGGRCGDGPQQVASRSCTAKDKARQGKEWGQREGRERCATKLCFSFFSLQSPMIVAQTHSSSLLQAGLTTRAPMAMERERERRSHSWRKRAHSLRMYAKGHAAVDSTACRIRLRALYS